MMTPIKKLLICVQQKVIYDNKKYFWKILTLIQMKTNHLNVDVVVFHLRCLYPAIKSV